jgi:hypothetical protein
MQDERMPGSMVQSLVGERVISFLFFLVAHGLISRSLAEILLDLCHLLIKMTRLSFLLTTFIRVKLPVVRADPMSEIRNR